MLPSRRTLLVVPLLLLTACGGTGEAVRPVVEPETAPQDAAAALVSYAAGSPSAVRWAAHVAYTISGEQVATFDAASADQREVWEGCPTGSATYEGRDCPVSVLRTLRHLAQDGAEAVIEESAPRVLGCNTYRAPDRPPASTAWIRPDAQHRGCFADFAVAVSVDDAGRVVAVDLALSGP